MLKNKLIQTLQQNLNCNLARLKSVSLLTNAILRHRTVNLVILATTADGKSCSNESRYRRFQDFFLNFSLCLTSVGKFILERIPKPPSGYILAMDRTNWQFGKRDINFLAVTIIVGKVSIPIVWKVLPSETKRGNSNTAQRINLTKKLLTLIPSSDIRVLTMDREFIGKKWLSWLDEQGVSYVVRIKKNTIVGKRLANEYTSKRGPKSNTSQEVFGLNLFFAYKRIEQGGRASHLFIISNAFQGKEALDLYRLRWGIERLFAHLKRKGFDLEATHMTDAAKLEKLFGIVTIAFLISFAWGCHLRVTGKKTSAAAKRKSLFRLGLEDVIRLFETPPNNSLLIKERRAFLQWLQTARFDSIFLV